MKDGLSKHNGLNGAYKPITRVRRPKKIKRFDTLTPNADSDEQEAPKKILVLSVQQKNIIIKIIAKYENIAIIRMVLAEEYPDFPVVADYTIRYYRRKVQAGAYKELQQSLEQAICASIARKSYRLAHLGRLFDRAIGVDAIKLSTYTDGDGHEQTKIEFNQHLAAHQRELLRQAREEIEGRGIAPGTLRAAESNANDEENPEDTDGRRVLLAGYVTAFKENMAAHQQALTAAQPPVDYE